MSTQGDRVAVLVVDDHELVRAGLRALLDGEEGLEVVGEAANGLDAVTEAARLRPDLVLLDMRLPDIGGAEVCRRILEAQPETKVLVLTSFDDDEEISASLLAGASGYVMKDIPPSELVHTILGVVQGRTILDPGVARRVFEGQLGRPSPDGDEAISPREHEVLELMARGMRNREIAQELWISEPTVKTHVSHIIRKLGQSDRTQAILVAMKRGIVRIARDA